MWWNARRLKLDWWLLGSVAALSVSLFLVRCGGTGSDLEGFPEGPQFVNEACNSDTTCLRFTIRPSRIPADGVSEATFIATLFNADDTPAANEEVCFFSEDPAAAAIVEPVGDSCQLTGPDGRVSGRVRAGLVPTSVRIIARNLARGLEVSVLLLLGEAQPPEPIPAGLSLIVVPNDLQAGQTATATARLRDSNNVPIAGATIVFSRIPAIGSLSASSAVTDASGQVSVIYTAGSLPPGTTDQTITITAQSGTLSANDDVTIHAVVPTATPTTVPTVTPVPTAAGCIPAGGDCSAGQTCCPTTPPAAALQCVNHGAVATCDPV